jgi:hypothetical protein
MRYLTAYNIYTLRRFDTYAYVIALHAAYTEHNIVADVYFLALVSCK